MIKYIGNEWSEVIVALSKAQRIAVVGVMMVRPVAAVSATVMVLAIVFVCSPHMLRVCTCRTVTCVRSC